MAQACRGAAFLAGARLATGLGADLAADLAAVFLAALEGTLTLTIFRGALTAGLAVVVVFGLTLAVLGLVDLAEVLAATRFAGLAAVLLTGLAAVLPAVLVAGFATAFLAPGRPGIWAFTGSGSTRLGALPA